MRALSFGVAAVGLLALVLGVESGDYWEVGLGIAALICAATTFLSADISSYLKVFAGIFSIETVVVGLVTIAVKAGVWPAALAAFQPPEASLEPFSITVAVFSILIYLISHLGVVRQITRIADLYYQTTERGRARIWPLPPYEAVERRIAVAMVVFLVLLNQAQVGISVKLSFFGRDWFNAIQNKDEAAFWNLLLFVFTPWAIVFITSGVIEFVVQSMLVIRWRRWLTDHFVTNWLGGHAHYRMSLVGSQTDNPDQRISEDINRFIDGGTDSFGGVGGYGIYSYSIALISTLSSLTAFVVILWVISENFTLPGTDIRVPGFLFWVALVYATIGTLVTHWIGRPLIRLFFDKQRVEANFRFSLARLREYSEQVALLSGERTEQTVLRGRFGSIIRNFLDLVRVRKWLTAFISFYGQISPYIPYIVAAPFYFAGKIQLGVMTQTASAFGRVDSSLNFFVNYYSSLATFKAVVNRLTSFTEAIERAKGMAAAGPIRLPARAGAPSVALEGIGIALPDGRRIVEAEGLSYAAGETALLAGPSGSGKSTLFRAISGIWPFGEGRIHVPDGAEVMVVPQKPYIPMGTLRAAISYPGGPDTYADVDIRRALDDAHIGFLADQLDREEIWSQRLSGGEQQRVAIARALLKKPDWLFLDESTSAVDEKLEAELYRMLKQRLPRTTIVSIGHRSTLTAFHARQLHMAEGVGGKFTPRDAKVEAAE
ncbi:MAG TPA: ABC transporter ATP-binding protein/permease [Xanthobacteraceae bacterium]|nr:ABC transporter ATP-binding protein/permease [Xanthobacteraceae bacterium]